MRPWTKCLYLASLLIYAFVPWTSYGHPLQISILDVGQGDSILIQTPNNHKILIDAGPDASVIDQLDQVLPFWDRNLNAIIPTHPQADHIAGFLLALQHFHIDQAFITQARSQSSLSATFDQDLAQDHVQSHYFYQGDTLNFHDGVQLQSLWPPAQTDWQHVVDLNDVAQVDRLTYGPFSALFTADAGANIDQQLLTQHPQPVTLLKVPHHGSKTGMDDQYLADIQPLISVISVGQHNRYGHPTQQALNQLRQAHSRIYRTDRDGRVTIGVDLSGFWIKTSHLTYNN